ncbi:MAG: hypothetical protein VKK04_00045 [Synechococcales bacterium]|nr:hypothetical protein [Synechococcales bacterium]
MTTFIDIVNPNDGVLSLQEAINAANLTTAEDTITDFHRGDRIQLLSGLQFGDITVRQQGTNTLLEIGNDSLALLEGVRANTITQAVFV